MSGLRTYAQELAAVEAVLAPRRKEARKWARPELWGWLRLYFTGGDGYFALGKPICTSSAFSFVGGSTRSYCLICNTRWHLRPCEHQLGLAALWVGGHPIQRSSDFWDHALARKLEGGAL